MGGTQERRNGTEMGYFHLYYRQIGFLFCFLFVFFAFFVANF